MNTAKEDGQPTPSRDIELARGRAQKVIDAYSRFDDGHADARMVEELLADLNHWCDARGIHWFPRMWFAWKVHCDEIEREESDGDSNADPNGTV